MELDKIGIINETPLDIAKENHYYEIISLFNSKKS